MSSARGKTGSLTWDAESMTLTKRSPHDERMHSMKPHTRPSTRETCRASPSCVSATAPSAGRSGPRRDTNRKLLSVLHDKTSPCAWRSRWASLRSLGSEESNPSVRLNASTPIPRMAASCVGASVGTAKQPRNVDVYPRSRMW